MESRNFILTGSAARYYWKGEGLCSVKTFCGGPAYYNTGKGNFRVDESCFLLLNDGTDYAIEIGQREPVHSFCLFFDRSLLMEAFYGAGRTDEYQLDNLGHYRRRPELFERTYPLASLGNAISNLRSAHEVLGAEPLWLEQSFLRVLDALKILQGNDRAAREQLRSMRAATREELYRRVLKAREYIHANAERPLSLQEIGLASHLSVNHLLRCFKQAFGTSPHAYLTGLKIARAQSLLKTTALSVSGIAQAVGFSSLGSFSLLFKQHCGQSPEAYRKSHSGDRRA